MKTPLSPFLSLQNVRKKLRGTLQNI
jgi:hypothetical protein